MSRNQVAMWLAFIACLAIAPYVFSGSYAITMLSVMGCLIVVCLSYNILLGQGGMLSFGHAVYVGLGSFAAIHAMQSTAVPLALVPIVGGIGGAMAAVVFGYLATRTSGTAFAMITLATGELVAAAASMYPGWSGGESGVSANRVYGSSIFGMTFASQTQVYWLIAVYCVVCAALMYYFTATPLGRMLNAVRDNAERVDFLGFDARQVRYRAFIVSGFFAGVGGGLLAINFEIVTLADSVSLLRSGNYLLFTFLGGAGFFFGPVIGAVLMVFATLWFSSFTPAWLLYTGVLFVVMVMYAPSGIAGIWSKLSPIGKVTR